MQGLSGLRGQHSQARLTFVVVIWIIFMEKNGKSHHETNQHLGICWLGTCHVWIVDVLNLFLSQATASFGMFSGRFYLFQTSLVFEAKQGSDSSLCGCFSKFGVFSQII